MTSAAVTWRRSQASLGGEAEVRGVAAGGGRAHGAGQRAGGAHEDEALNGAKLVELRGVEVLQADRITSPGQQH